VIHANIPCEERKISELGCEYAELLEKEIGGARMVNKSGIIPGDKIQTTRPTILKRLY
jgi:hypothetical protein